MMKASLTAVAAGAAMLLSACGGTEVVVVTERIMVVDEVLAAPAPDTPESEVIRIALDDSERNLDVIRTELEVSGMDIVRIDVSGDTLQELNEASQGNSVTNETQAVLPVSTTQVSALVASSGVTYVGGSFSGTLDLGDGSEDMPEAQGEDGFVAMMSSDGQVAKVVTFSSPHYDSVTHLVATGDGAVVALGTFQSQMSPAGVVLTSSGESDAFAARIFGGEIAWVMQVGTAGYDSFTDAALSEGTVLAVGSVDGGANNDDGVLCSFNIFGGNFNCSRNETAEVDRYTGLVEADETEADVVLEVIDNTGDVSSETISVEVPETPEATDGNS